MNPNDENKSLISSAHDTTVLSARLTFLHLRDDGVPPLHVRVALVRLQVVHPHVECVLHLSASNHAQQKRNPHNTSQSDDCITATPSRPNPQQPRNHSFFEPSSATQANSRDAGEQSPPNQLQTSMIQASKPSQRLCARRGTFAAAAREKSHLPKAAVRGFESNKAGAGQAEGCGAAGAVGASCPVRGSAVSRLERCVAVVPKLHKGGAQQSATHPFASRRASNLKP